MEDLQVVLLGFTIVEVLIVVLGTARWSIKKGQNAKLWLLAPIVLTAIAPLYLSYRMGVSDITLLLISTLINFAAPLVLYFIPAKERSGEMTYFEEQVLELTQPFIDLTKTSRALLGLNIAYTIEGLTYFGVVGLLAIYFNNFIGLDDIDAGRMVGVLTAGITIAMLFLGATVDWIGLRKSLIIALSFMLIGRVLLAAAPEIGTTGIWNSAHIFAMLGILGIILGYGIFQPACYAGVKQLTNEKTSAMGYAMLYGLMNLGGFLPGIISPPVRRIFDITGVFWVYVFLTVVGIGIVYFIITKKAMKTALDENKEEGKEATGEEDESQGFKVFVEAFKQKVVEKKTIVFRLTFILAAFIIIAALKEFNVIDFGSSSSNAIWKAIVDINWYIAVVLIGLSFAIYIITDARFTYFVFILIFVQTLFAHNWLTIPQYTSRAFEGFVSENFEFFVNLNPIIIFILTPMVAALTAKKNTYNMMIIGTFVMAAPTFILAIGPTFETLMAYLIIMTIGEAMWQPRFLQWVAEIAPKSMTGIYMGIGQFPWFLTKVITSLYSGWFLIHYCPADTPPSEMNTQMMWLIYGVIAMVSPVGLLLAKGWMVKGFKTKHEE